MPRQIRLELLDQEFGVKGPKIKTTSQAKRIINRNKLSAPLSVKNTDTSLDVMLSNMSITIVSMDEEDFSFKNDSKNIELLQNPNILQKKSFAKLKNNKTEIRDKFSNEDDPFYELDDPPESNERQKLTVNNMDNSEVLADIAQEIFSLNLSNDTAVKQFRSLE
jgi:hypothetical protein